MTTYSYLILGLIFVLFSCGSGNHQNDDDISELRKSIELANEKETSFIKKYGAIQLGENELKFTYQIQELFYDSNKVISISGYIRDIIQVNGDFVFRLVTEFMDKEFIAEILVAKEKYQKVKSQLESESQNLDGCFIFKPTSVRSSSLLNIEPEVYYGDTRDDDEIDITYQFDGTIFIIKGEMIDYYLKE